METIETYDLFGSYNKAAQFCGCSADAVKKLVQEQNAEQIRTQVQFQRHPRSTDKFAAVIEEAVNHTKAKIRAKQIHTRLVALGYTASMRSTRRAFIHIS